MILASHVILTAYGFWLPNDPRGSWSDFVGAWELFRFGRATRVHTRRSLARDEHDRQVRRAAKTALKYPPVQFTGPQALAIARGFAELAEASGLAVWACSVLPEHVHLVLGRHRLLVERIVNLLKGRATGRLMREQLHPMARFRAPGGRCPSPWARNHWKVFLDCHRDITRAVRYVEDNPLKEGKRPQRWSFVTPVEE